MEIQKSIAYLQGLVEGLEYDGDTKEGKVFCAVLDILREMTQELELLSASGQYCEDMIEEILDEQLDYDDEDFEEGFIEVECPNCSDTVYFDEDTFAEKKDLICPNCLASIE